MTDRPDEASRLARLLRDIEELEKARTVLLQRVELSRARLLEAGNRTAAIRASVDLLCDHISDVVTSEDEISMLENEIRESDRSLEEVRREASGLVFEAESFQETLDEADEEFERLSSILVGRRNKNTKGH
jgi:chromosome segregation ATPase